MWQCTYVAMYICGSWRLSPLGIDVVMSQWGDEAPHMMHYCIA